MEFLLEFLSTPNTFLKDRLGETFVKIGTSIERLQQDFSKAKGQLNEGKGNIIRRLEGMKTLGITPKKQIPDSL